MKRSGNTSFHRQRFSHIYVEEAAFAFPLVDKLTAEADDATIIPIDNYKSVFNRKRQHFDLQKRSPKLILAVKRPPFLYELSPRCQRFGNGLNLYTTPVLNCPFDCAYCFLRGLYDSANIVVFVNTDEYFGAVRRAVENNLGKTSSPLTLHLSYESDILGLEALLGLGAEWSKFVRDTVGLSIELRTKASISAALLRLFVPSEGFIVAWSLAPDVVIRKFERKTPNLKARLRAMARAADAGHSLRLCIDPVIPIDEGSAVYRALIDEIFELIPKGAIKDAAVGPFRVGDEHLKKMSHQPPVQNLLRSICLEKGDAICRDVETSLAARLGRDRVIRWI